MKSDKFFWDIHLTKPFKSNYLELLENERWRLKHFLNNIRYIKNPVNFYNSTQCPDCPPGFQIFGISDNGSGHKGVEVLLCLDKKTHVIWCIKCETKKIK